jgi:hypothetical protein
MKIGNIDAGEEHSKYVWQVYQEKYQKLHSYFLAQLDDSSEADDCVLETIRCLFFFMEDRDWETESEYISVYLMRIAGFLCSRKLSEKRLLRANSLFSNRITPNKIRVATIWVIKECVKFIKAFLRLPEYDSKRLSEV